MSNLQALKDNINKMIPEFKKVLPADLDVDKFTRIANTALSNNEALHNCDAKSLLNAFMRCAQDGLLPDGREAFINTFRNKRAGTTSAQYIPMVDGVLKRVRQSGQVVNIASKVVYEGDDFDYYFDENGEHIRHSPKFKSQQVRLVFAFAKMTTGEILVEVLSLAEVNKIKASSKSGSYESAPWNKWFDRMACKSALLRLAKRLPSASEIQEMMDRDQDFSFDNRFNAAQDVTPQQQYQAVGLEDALRQQPEQQLDQPQFQNTQDQNDQGVFDGNNEQNPEAMFDVQV